MRRRPSTTRRRGSILPLVAVCLIGLMGLIALAIDIGLIAVVRTQTQAAADASAMAGARTINGDADPKVNYNYDAIMGAAIKAANANSIVGQSVKGNPSENWDPKDADGNPDKAAKDKVHPNDFTYKTGQVTVEVGSYTYLYDDANPSKEAFALQFPRPDTVEPYSAVRTTIAGEGNFQFGRVFGLTTFNVTAAATAVHRPRDVVVVMDLSGSMRFQSLPGVPRSGRRTTSMNPETVFPRFGHYSATASAALQGTASVPSGGGEYFDPSNISSDQNPGPAILKDFFKNTSGKSKYPDDCAFTRAPDTYETTPGGDNYLRTAGDTAGNPYAATVDEVVGGTGKNAAFETNGYPQFRTGTTFAGYTEGPGFWGKTFAVWPPDPRGADPAKDPNAGADHHDNGAKDWRQRFFFKYNAATDKLGWLDHDNILWETPSGTHTIKRPQTTTTVTEVVNGTVQNVTYNWRINYAAILHWLRQTPAPFPGQIRAGRIKYYDAIPDPSADAALNNRFWTNQTLTNLNERFWREYIDFVLGLEVTGTNNGVVTYARDDGGDPLSSMIGNGDYYTWGTFQVKQKPFPHQDQATGAAWTANQLNPLPSLGALTAQINKGAGHVAGDTALTIDTLLPSPVPAPTLARQALVTFTISGTPYWHTLSAVGGTSMTLTSGLKVAVPDNTVVSFKSRLTTSAINETAGYATGATSLLVSNIPAGYSAGDAVRITHDGKQLYYFLADAPTPSTTPTTITLKGTGLQFPAANGDAVDFVPIDHTRYVDYKDNPKRAKHQFWFGPMTWLDWLGNYNTGKFWWPGNVHEAQAWACKVGIQSAIDDIKKNHPSDFIGLAFFSSPKYSAGGGGQYNMATVPLGRDYQKLKDSLWFPPSTVVGGVTEITPYDTDMANVPRANGGTCYQMGFMIAYNLLSSAPSLRDYSEPQPKYRGTAGGLGRKGASRLIIFETDGSPNTGATASLTGSGSDRYYPIRVKNPANLSDASKNTEWPADPGSFKTADLYTVVDQIAADVSQGGFSTTRKPMQIYSIAYGSLFDSVNSSTTGHQTALGVLQTIQVKGKTATSTTWSDFPTDQKIFGTTQQRVEKMQAAFSKIMQAGVQVSLIE